MNRDDEYMIKLLSSSIRQKTPDLPDYEPVNWHYIYAQAARHNILPLLYVALKELPSSLQPEFMKQWQHQSLMLCAGAIKLNNESFQLIDLFKAADIEVLLYKGLAISELYPEPYLRISGDIDLLIREENLEAVIDLLCRNGYQRSRDSIEKAFYYFISPTGAVIDLQTKVWNYYSNRDRNLSDMIERTAWQNTKIVTVDGHEIPTLGTQEHFFCIICHAAKHFISYGTGIRHIIDIALYVNKYGAFIDWQVLFDNLKRIKLDTFLMAILQICKRYLHIDERPMTYHHEINSDTVDVLLDDFISAGLFGTSSHEKSSKVITGTYYFNRARVNRSHIARSTLFPPAEEIDYAYAKKNRVLLFVAWFHRGLKYIVRKNKKSDTSGIMNRIDRSYEKLKLLEKLEII